MLSFSARQRYFLYRGATDMRKGFNGLSGLVRRHIRQGELLSGDVFIFLNKRRDRICADKPLKITHLTFAITLIMLSRGFSSSPPHYLPLPSHEVVDDVTVADCGIIERAQV